MRVLFAGLLLAVFGCASSPPPSGRSASLPAAAPPRGKADASGLRLDLGLVQVEGSRRAWVMKVSLSNMGAMPRRVEIRLEPEVVVTAVCTDDAGRTLDLAPRETAKYALSEEELGDIYPGITISRTFNWSELFEKLAPEGRRVTVEASYDTSAYHYAGWLHRPADPVSLTSNAIRVKIANGGIQPGDGG